MQSARIAMLTAAGAALLIGCQSRRAGVVSSVKAPPGWEKGPAVGLTAPETEFTDPDGRRHPLGLASGWVSIVGFMESTGRECCMLSPQLTEAADRYRDRAVRVVQVALPTAECPYGPGCVETCHVQPLHLLALCDSDQVAYRAFGEPADRTLLVIDRRGHVARVTTVEQVGGIYHTVDELARQPADVHAPTYLEIHRR